MPRFLILAILVVAVWASTAAFLHFQIGLAERQAAAFACGDAGILAIVLSQWVSKGTRGDG